VRKYRAFLFIRRRRPIVREPDALTIFAGAKVNRGANSGETGHYSAWKWPTRTWFQKRKRELGIL
jgi:hypothetical protein